MYGNFHYASKVMHLATSVWNQIKMVGSFCDLTQWNTLVTHEAHVIKIIKSFDML